MGKAFCKFIVWASIIGFILVVPLTGLVVATGGGGDGGGGGGGDGDVSGGSAALSNFIPGETTTIFGAPDIAGNTITIMDKTNNIANTWGGHTKDKPDHWSDEQWRSYLKKRQGIFRDQQMRAFNNMNAANRNLNIARGTGKAAAAAGALVGAMAAPAAGPVITIISITGDGAAATAGSLSEGKTLRRSLNDGIKKAACTAILSKVCLGGKAANASKDFVGGQIYDHSAATPLKMKNRMPPPNFTTSGGHGIYK